MGKLLSLPALIGFLIAGLLTPSGELHADAIVIRSGLDPRLDRLGFEDSALARSTLSHPSDATSP